MSKVRLVSVTQPVLESLPTAEALMAYCARVSSPHQDNPSYDKLLKYCFTNGHFSVFELADMCVEIETSRAIAAQILRHRSFSFQEFSQRYATATGGIQVSEARRQDTKNRQNSIDDLPQETKDWFTAAQADIAARAETYYQQALEAGVAKECARMVLPLNTTTKLYMKGSVRSWIHYCQVRTDPATQLEHRQIAEECKTILLEQFPSLKDLL